MQVASDTPYVDRTTAARKLQFRALGSICLLKMQNQEPAVQTPAPQEGTVRQTDLFGSHRDTAEQAYGSDIFVPPAARFSDFVDGLRLQDAAGLFPVETRSSCVWGGASGSGAERYRVLDLFAGMGGFSLGFSQAGFDVVGVDRIPWTGMVFGRWNIGTAHTIDLSNPESSEQVLAAGAGASVLIGGPPCRPWSLINQQRRRAEHADQPLLSRFFDFVREIAPRIFVFENVPPVWQDPVYQHQCELLRQGSTQYSVSAMIVRYDQFGAPTARQRLVTVGVRGGGEAATEFFTRLAARLRKPSTVRNAIAWLRDIPRDGESDHAWPKLNTIEKYRERYRTGQYGWRRLDYDSPAPSFGNVTKTYVLHPEAGESGFDERILSVRELLCIMGFPKEFHFPEGIPLPRRYQMVADVVSPVFSEACAHVTREMLATGAGYGHSGS